jgi:predicted PurR-regulated permease PerM
LPADTTTHVDQANVTTPVAAAPCPDSLASEPVPAPPSVPLTPAQLVFRAAGVVVLLYFARPVALPIVLACVAGMTLKPLVRWLSYCRIPPVLGAAIVLGLLVAGVVFGSVQLGRPAVAWVNEAPEHMEKLRQRVQSVFKHAAWVNQTAAAVSALGTTDEDQKKPAGTAMKDARAPAFLNWSRINWTGTLLAMVGETLVLLYLLLASGDLFLQKLVHVMPTMSDKKRAVEISRELQQNISNYLFAVSLVNICLGVIVSGGLYLLGVPNAATWGLLVAVLNFIPYFGPVAGIVLLSTVGLLSFEMLWKSLLPPAWYLLLHLLEANLITPVVLGRRFTLNPVVIFVSLIFWTWLWGLPGALLSVPILVSVKVVCDRVPSLSPFSELLEN